MSNSLRAQYPHYLLITKPKDAPLEIAFRVAAEFDQWETALAEARRANEVNANHHFEVLRCWREG